MTHRTTNIIMALLGLFLVGCAGDGGRGCLGGPTACVNPQLGDVLVPVEDEDDDDNENEGFLCSATPSQTIVRHQEVLRLDIHVRGGLPPYSIYKGLMYPIESFATSTALLGSYNNTSGTSQVNKRSVYIRDAAGRETHCNFEVTVRPANYTSTLACTIEPATPYVKSGTPVKFTLRGTGGTGKYTFTDFAPASGWQVADSHIKRVSDAEAEVTVVYNQTAVRFPRVTVKNGTDAAVCRTAVFVNTAAPPGFDPGWDWTYLPPWWGPQIPYLPPYLPPPYPGPGPVSCSVATTPNPAPAGTLTRVSATVPGPTGAGFRMDSLSVLNASTGSYALYDELSDIPTASQRERVIRFRRPGSHLVRVSLYNPSTFQYAHCSAYHQVRAASEYSITPAAGTAAQVKNHAGLSPAPVSSATVLGGNSSRGARVARGDVTGDGIPDIIVGAGPGTGHRVQLRDGTNPARLILEFDPLPSHGGDGGVFVAVGDINADGHADIIVGQDEDNDPASSSGSWIKIYGGAQAAAGQTTLLRGFQPFGAFRGGLRVAAGDVNGDGYSDIAVTGGPGGQAKVRIYDGRALAVENRLELVRNQFHAFGHDSGDVGVPLSTGTFVAMGDVDGDGFADVITSLDQNREYTARYRTEIRIYSGADLVAYPTNTPVPWSYRPVPYNTSGGIRITTADVNGDGRADIVTGSGQGQSGRIKAYSLTGFGGLVLDFFSHSTFFNGIFVGGGTGGL